MRLDRLDGDSPVERRLAAFQPLVVATALRWAHRYSRDAEDLGQEILVALWHVLEQRPEVPAAYLARVADRAARDALRREKSVDKVIGHDGRPRRTPPLMSLDALQEDKAAWRELEVRLARRFWGMDIPRPTEELALAQVVVAQLCTVLTPRQREVLKRRLLGYSEREVARMLGLSPTRAHYILAAICRKCRALLDGSLPLPDERDTGWGTAEEAAEASTRRESVKAALRPCTVRCTCAPPSPRGADALCGP